MLVFNSLFSLEPNAKGKIETELQMGIMNFTSEYKEVEFQLRKHTRKELGHFNAVSDVCMLFKRQITIQISVFTDNP